MNSIELRPSNSRIIWLKLLQRVHLSVSDRIIRLPINHCPEAKHLSAITWLFIIENRLNQSVLLTYSLIFRLHLLVAGNTNRSHLRQTLQIRHSKPNKDEWSVRQKSIFLEWRKDFTLKSVFSIFCSFDHITKLSNSLTVFSFFFSHHPFDRLCTVHYSAGPCASVDPDHLRNHAWTLSVVTHAPGIALKNALSAGKHMHKQRCLQLAIDKVHPAAGTTSI